MEPGGRRDECSVPAYPAVPASSFPPFFQARRAAASCMQSCLWPVAEDAGGNGLYKSLELLAASASLLDKSDHHQYFRASDDNGQISMTTSSVDRTCIKQRRDQNIPLTEKGISAYTWSNEGFARRPWFSMTLVFNNCGFQLPVDF